MLILLLDAKARAPVDKTTGKPVTDCQERIRFLVNTHGKTKGSRIIIPTPALAEFLVRCTPESMADYMSYLQRLRAVKVAPFAQKAAIEFADMQRALIPAAGRRIKATELETRSKAKFDQQIVAIARAEGASTIYSDDAGLASYARHANIDTIGVADLPLSPDTAQGSLTLDPPEPVAPSAKDEP